MGDNPDEFFDADTEDPGTCVVCGKEYEIVRPGKEQPTCDCHLRCPCGRMKSWYAVTEHPTDPKSSGYLCPACGMVGPNEAICKKSLVSTPSESARLLTYIKLGKVDLPIPFGHGFFFNTEEATLVYSPYAYHAVNRHSWSMDSDFPLTIPEDVRLEVDSGFWVMMSSIILISLDGHPEISKWQVVYEIARKMETEQFSKAMEMRRYESCTVILRALIDKKNLEPLKIELKRLRPDLSVKDIGTALKSLPFNVGRYPIGNCLIVQCSLFNTGAFATIESQPYNHKPC